MTGFTYTDNRLSVDDLDIETMLQGHQTPCYIYSVAKMSDNYRRLDDALKAEMPNHDILICYATKANGHLAVIDHLNSLGSGADVVSGGEMVRALRAGIPADKIVFSGVGKTADEIKAALEADILQINVESHPEIDRINDIASELGIKARIGLRINPDVEGGEHDKTSTGRKTDKFGIDFDHAITSITYAKGLPHIDVKGISVHIGSQIVDITPFEAAYTKLVGLVKDLENQGITLETIDLGGGMSITYTDETPFDTTAYAKIVKDTLGQFDVKLIFEPGRYIVGDAGVLMATVQYFKSTPEGHNFAILDAGMVDLMRPAMYGAVHPVLPVVKDDSREVATYDIVGPICESSDIFEKGATGPKPEQGDLLAITVSGAYAASMSMATVYNTRLRPQEILVKDGKAIPVNTPSSFDAILAEEIIPR